MVYATTQVTPLPGAKKRWLRLRIDAHSKRLVFSDGLNLDSALQLYHHFADRIQLGFGIDTHLTNNMGLNR